MSEPIPSTSRPTSDHNQIAQLERKTDIAAQPSSPQLLQPSPSSSRTRSRSRSRSPARSTSTHATTSTRASWFSTISSTWTQATSTLAWTASSTLGSSTTAPIRSTSTAATAASNAQRAALPQEWKNLSDHAGLSQGDRKARAMAELATSGGGSSYQAEDDPLLETLLYRVTCRTSGSGSTGSGAKTPLLVLAACYLPSATSPGYDTILEALTNRLEAYARNGPYSLILLASPVPNPPPTARLISLFLNLSRETRKNVLKVWVVGGGWPLRALLALFTSRLLSGKAKATRKMVHCATLGALSKEVGSAIFLGVEFPPEVYAANARHESHGDLAASLDRTSSKQFGVPLSEASDKEPPSCVVDCFEVLRTQGRYAWYKARERGLIFSSVRFIVGSESTGIFRKSPSAMMVAILQAAYDRGHTLTLPTYPDAPHLAASLLKLYLCSLPTPIFPFSLESTIISCPLPRSEAEVYLRTNMLPSLPAPERNLLGQLVDILRAIEANKAHNKMYAYNLVVCLTPTLWTGIDATGSKTQSRGATAVTASTAEEIKSMLGMCSVPDGKGGAEGNTVAGVLKVMIEA
ncbi:BZ3500_MvSof-1268-A1-R1_Chr1-3g01676 [Microbotryum saponariae]|uniref:BZ3500_MvSof-1268-A1-R1_Chr1-3g01676 protein n=1 Tax=Microbotryum saponariae TaxID=289078 RepID=A0A2X0MQW5_9BASI|nr:BZ3500_MvSof-1268-A1-R1_Chr1-3g01676 [Microbotryum saponariae]SCZ94295.1 BZ3501_MvSof-1269-A2-R1_Chr1-3g01277 [Microbotryum saponariae]